MIVEGQVNDFQLDSVKRKQTIFNTEGQQKFSTLHKNNEFSSNESSDEVQEWEFNLRRFLSSFLICSQIGSCSIESRHPINNNNNIMDQNQQVAFSYKIIEIQKEQYLNNQLEKQSSGEQFKKKGQKLFFLSQRLSIIWQRRGFQIIRLVSRFIQQLKTNTIEMRFKLLTNKIFNIYGDRAADYHEVDKWKKKGLLRSKTQKIFFQSTQHFRSALQQLQKIANCCDKFIKVLQPDSTIKLVWDMIVLFFIIINIFYIPMKLSFNITELEDSQIQLLFETIPSIVFICEILLNFNTAFYDEGMIHDSRKEIFYFYVSKDFGWDLIVVIPFIISRFNIPFMEYTLLLRITKVSKMIEDIENSLNLKESFQAIFDLGKLIYFVIFVTHFCACVWHYIGIMEIESMNSQQSWLLYYNVYHNHWFDRYVTSLYWSVITSLTVGYGDIVPQTQLEKFYVICVSMGICGILGYTISSIGEIFKSLQEKKSYYKSRMTIINQYIKNRGLNKQLQLKVRKYFEYYFKMEVQQNSHAEQLMNQMTKGLKEEVLIDLYKKTLENSRLIKNNFSDATINKLCTKLKEQKYAPESTVLSVGDQANKLIFVLNGSLESHIQMKNLSISDNGKILKTYSQNQVIGEREFAQSSQYEYSLRTKQFTEVAMIDFNDFIKTIKENQNEYEQFCMLKDNLQFNEKQKNAGGICEICGWTHSYLNCPFVFLQTNKWKIAAQFNKTSLQPRKCYSYRERKKQHTLSNIFTNQDSCLEYLILSGRIKEGDLTDSFLMKLGVQVQSQESPILFQESKIAALNELASPSLLRFQEIQLKRPSALQMYLPHLQGKSSDLNDNTNATQNLQIIEEVIRRRSESIKKRQRLSIPPQQQKEFIAIRPQELYENSRSIESEKYQSNILNEEQGEEPQIEKNMQSTEFLKASAITNELPLSRLSKYIENQGQNSEIYPNSDFNIDSVKSYKYYFNKQNVEEIAKRINLLSIRKAKSKNNDITQRYQTVNRMMDKLRKQTNRSKGKIISQRQTDD